MKSTWDRNSFTNISAPFRVAKCDYPILVIKDKGDSKYNIHMLNPRDKLYYK